MKRLDVPAKPDNAVFSVAKDHIDGKFHKEHVDRVTACDDERMLGGKFAFSQQALHAACGIIGKLCLGGDACITG